MEFDESVNDFYSGKVLFITGATGFLGRLLLAKLMRMGNVKKILLLSRPKKEKSNQERLNAILSGFLFEEVDKFDVKFRSKLRIINGDMEVEDLGISSDDREYIKNNVQIIIHAAATVRFDEELRKAIAINVRGTKNMLDMATEVKNLQTFVHISTAYSQCPRSDIFEVFYEPPMDYCQAFDLLNNFDDDFVNSLTAKLINPWPNTYTFTKAISEDMIRQYQNKLPVVIVRPSLVQGTFLDPVPGYTDTILGFLGLGVGLMVGIIRVGRLGKPETLMNVIPADFVINSFLAVGRHGAKTSSDIRIFNCVSSQSNLKPMDTIINEPLKLMSEFPFKKMIWMPHLTLTKSKFTYKLLYFLYHYVPAFFVDIILHFKGLKLSVMKIYSKIFYHLGLYEYFMEHTWEFSNENMKQVHSKMTKNDIKVFPLFSPETGFYEQYSLDSYHGIRKYLLKESDEDLIDARKKYRILKFSYHFLWTTVYCGLAYFAFSRLNFSNFVQIF